MNDLLYCFLWLLFCAAGGAGTAAYLKRKPKYISVTIIEKDGTVVHGKLFRGAHTEADAVIKKIEDQIANALGATKSTALSKNYDKRKALEYGSE